MQSPLKHSSIRGDGAKYSSPHLALPCRSVVSRALQVRPRIMRPVYGFTMVELITTIVIVGILAMVSGPVFFNVQVFQARGFFDETVSAVRYAQKYAVASGCTVRVNIAANGFSLWTAANPACNNLAACAAVNFGLALQDPVDGALTFTRVTPSADLALAPAGDICFRPDGTTTLAADTVVTVGASQFRISAGSGFAQCL